MIHVLHPSTNNSPQACPHQRVIRMPAAIGGSNTSLQVEGENGGDGWVLLNELGSKARAYDYEEVFLRDAGNAPRVVRSDGPAAGAGGGEESPSSSSSIAAALSRAMARVGSLGECIDGSTT